MKHLRKIADFADRAARRLGLDVEQVSGFGDGSYRVEFKEREEKPRPVRGFVYEPDAVCAGSDTRSSANAAKAGRPAGRNQ